MLTLELIAGGGVATGVLAGLLALAPRVVAWIDARHDDAHRPARVLRLVNARLTPTTRRIAR